MEEMAEEKVSLEEQLKEASAKVRGRDERMESTSRGSINIAFSPVFFQEFHEHLVFAKTIFLPSTFVDLKNGSLVSQNKEYENVFHLLLLNVCVQVEALRRQDSSQRLRQVEEELADARAELQGAREREGQARETERVARQTAAKAEDKSSQLEQQLTEVSMFNHLMWGENIIDDVLFISRDWQLPERRGSRPGSRRPCPLAPPPHQSGRRKWGRGSRAL